MSAREKLTALINECSDVKTLHALEPLRDGRWLYLIETPFLTFPRFVVGCTDAANEAPVVRMKCGRSEGAYDLFQEVLTKEGSPV